MNFLIAYFSSGLNELTLPVETKLWARDSPSGVEDVKAIAFLSVIADRADSCVIRSR